MRIFSSAGLSPGRLWDPAGLLTNRRRSVFAVVKGNQSMKATTHLRVVPMLPAPASVCVLSDVVLGHRDGEA